MSARELRVGLIGAGIQQSLSPSMHEEEARHHGLHLRYELIDLDRVPAGALALSSVLDAAQAQGYAGVNITFPCKQTVLPLLDTLSEDARAIGAVNTVIFRDGKRLGFNTDTSGWRWALQQHMPDADLSRVALVGAGGAGAAIAHAAIGLGVRQLRIVDREQARAMRLASELNARVGTTRANGDDARAVVPPTIDAALVDASGLIHATPTGMMKFPGIAVPARWLRPPLWVAETVYFPLLTPLLQLAREHGCETMDGGGMAAGQAAHAFALFTGCPADVERMHRHLRQLLAS